MSNADLARKGVCATAFLLVMLSSVLCHAGMFSSAQEFLAQDWRTEEASGQRLGAEMQMGAGTLPLAVGPFPVREQYLKVEAVPFVDIPKIMGPGEESSPAWPLAEGFPGRCYVSGQSGDATALLFVWGTNGMAQCIGVFDSRAQLSPSVACAPSEYVNARLRTPEGLRLGMTRAEVESLLGAPGESAANRIGYARRFTLAATEKLLRELGRKREPGAEAVTRYQNVMVWFREGRVIGFSVEQNSHYN
jgi:hypothetical protein